MKRLLLATSTTMMLCFSLSAFALNFSFLNDSPVESFNKADRQLQDAAADKALDSVANGKKLSWTNAKTGNGGFVQPLSTFKRDGMICRNLKIFNQDYKNRTDEYVFLFCKYRDGWKMPGGA